ncbi:unnamed protein product [Protopolystoma xenopodis]|uniref:Ion transport domain-containing protein n=1 Tax=Protopolystoma xenopodis TaxID=117903 RepID=A0A448XFF5_9PLAT|nr:unnamed protein product [Protopolystoma xenopodis]
MYELHFHFTTQEYISLSYVLGYSAEEIRQLCLQARYEGMSGYFKDKWNWLDILAILFTLCGFIIRCTAQCQEPSQFAEAFDRTMYLARNIYLIGLHLFFIRTLFITSISPKIGPRLKMMTDMLKKDLIPLLIVFAIFITTFGVWIESLLHPNRFYMTKHQIQSEYLNITRSFNKQQFEVRDSIGNLFKRAFYSIFEVSTILDEVEKCRGRCGHRDGNDIVAFFVLVLYTGIVNIILINLLIALFSNTVSRIDQKSAAHWLAERYKIIEEYSQRSILPSPFNLVSILFELIAFCIRRWCRCTANKVSHSVSKSVASSSSNMKYTSRARSNSLKVRSSDLGVKMESGSDSQNSNEEVFELMNPARNDNHQDINYLVCREKRIRRTKLMDETINSHLLKMETDIFLKFILIQSFALKDGRYTLGPSTQTIGHGTGSGYLAGMQQSGGGVFQFGGSCYANESNAIGNIGSSNPLGMVRAERWHMDKSTGSQAPDETADSVVGLLESRVGSIETQLIGLDAKLDQILSQLAEMAPRRYSYKAAHSTGFADALLASYSSSPNLPPRIPTSRELMMTAKNATEVHVPPAVTIEHAAEEHDSTSAYTKPSSH